MEPHTAEGVENVDLRVNGLLLTRFPHARPGKSRPEPSVVGAVGCDALSTRMQAGTESVGR